MTAMQPYVKEYNSEGKVTNPLGPEGYIHPTYQYKDEFGRYQFIPYPNHLARKRLDKKQPAVNNRKLTLGRFLNRVFHPLFNYFINGVPVTSKEYKKDGKATTSRKVFTGKFKVVPNLN